ncbi:hypothetical protein HaLaN_11796, partial [Haematococcus lacustris]
MTTQSHGLSINAETGWSAIHREPQMTSLIKDNVSELWACNHKPYSVHYHQRGIVVQVRRVLLVQLAVKEGILNHWHPMPCSPMMLTCPGRGEPSRRGGLVAGGISVPSSLCCRWTGQLANTSQ